jgi:drug/metabolite transporter (DMT)-like permease
MSGVQEGASDRCVAVATRWVATLPVLVAFAIIYLVWGSTYLAIAVAVETIPPFTAMAARMLIAGGVLVAFARLRGEARLTWTEWRESAVIGSLLFVGGYGVLAWAEQSVASGVAALLASTSPFWLVMLQWRGGERPSRLTLLGLLLGTVGVGLLLNGGSAGTMSEAVRMTAIVFGAFFWGMGTLRASRRVAAGSAARTAGSEMFAGGLVMVVLAVLLGEGSALRTAAISRESLLAVGYLALFGSVIAFTAYRWLLGRVAAALVATHSYVNPFIALLVGWWFAQEAIGAGVIAASVAIVGAVALLRAGTARAAVQRKAAPTFSRDGIPAPRAATTARPSPAPGRSAA